MRSHSWVAAGWVVPEGPQWYLDLRQSGRFWSYKVEIIGGLGRDSIYFKWEECKSLGPEGRLVMHYCGHNPQWITPAVSRLLDGPPPQWPWACLWFLWSIGGQYVWCKQRLGKCSHTGPCPLRSCPESCMLGRSLMTDHVEGEAPSPQAVPV